MNRLLRNFENEASPLFFSGMFILLMIAMSVYIVFFSGQFVEIIPNGNGGNGDGNYDEPRDYCALDVSLDLGKVCRDGDYLKMEINNSGTIEIVEFVFQVVESDQSYVSYNNTRLYPGYSWNYYLDYQTASDVQYILVTPKILVEDSHTMCPALNYVPASISSCSSSGGGGSSSGGSSSSGGGSDDPPQCSDGDGDGYGDNCDPGEDCDDGNPDIWENIDVYADMDQDGYGAGDALDPQVCVGLLDFETLEALRSVNKSPNDDDCNDTNPDINPDAIEDCSDEIDDDCDRSLCPDCGLNLAIPPGGCICDGFIRYGGYCCEWGHTLTRCFEIYDPDDRYDGGGDGFPIVLSPEFFSDFYRIFWPLLS